MRKDEERVGQKEALEGAPEPVSGIGSQKPWEETWTAVLSGPACDFPSQVLNESGDPVLYAAERGATVRAAHPAVQLAACAPELARMLLSHEWSDHGAYDEATCMECAGSFSVDYVTNEAGIAVLTSTVDHETDCDWLLLMKKAGLR